MEKECLACSKKPLDKDTIGINRKMLGNQVKTFYCMDCLADYLGCSVDDLLEKIEEFKDEDVSGFLYNIIVPLKSK